MNILILLPWTWPHSNRFQVLVRNSAFESRSLFAFGSPILHRKENKSHFSPTESSKFFSRSMQIHRLDSSDLFGLIDMIIITHTYRALFKKQLFKLMPKKRANSVIEIICGRISLCNFDKDDKNVHNEWRTIIIS